MKSDVEVEFPNIYFKDKIVREIMISVSHAEIPNSFYLVNSTNNTLVVNSSTFTIPPGNYNAVNFQSAISSFLSSLGITISYNIISNKYTFTSGSSFTIQTTSTCERFIGMGSVALSGTSVISPHVCNFLPLSRLIIRSSAFSTSNYNSADKSNDLILSVQNSSAAGSLILWNNYSNLKYDITHLDSINLVDLQITDDLGNFIDFNNADWFLTFRIEYMYEVSPNSITNFKQAVMVGSSNHGGN